DGHAAVDDDGGAVLDEGRGAASGGDHRGAVDRRHRHRLVGLVAGERAVVGDEGDHPRRGARVEVGVVVGHRLQAGLVSGDRLTAADAERGRTAAAHRQAGAGGGGERLEADVLEVGDGHRRRGEVGGVDVGHGDAGVDDHRTAGLGERGAAAGGGHDRRVVDRRYVRVLGGGGAVGGAGAHDEGDDSRGVAGVLVGVVVGD